MPKDKSLPRPSEFQFCCGTSCDAQANMDYVKQLEAELIDLQDRNDHVVNLNRTLLEKTVELEDEVVEQQMTIKSRDRALRIVNSKIKRMSCTWTPPKPNGVL